LCRPPAAAESKRAEKKGLSHEEDDFADCRCIVAGDGHRSTSAAGAGDLGTGPQVFRVAGNVSAASETRSYDLRPDGYVVNLVTRKLTNGHPDFIQIASKSDGKDYPQYQSGLLAAFQIDGTRTPVTYSETVIDDHAVNVIAKVNGQILNKGVRRIDADGKTMTIDVVQIDQSGKETPIKLVFKRVAGK
jgi:hypothetical protein